MFIKFALCFLAGVFFGVMIVSLVSGNRPDDEYTDGFKDGYQRAKEDLMKLP